MAKIVIGGPRQGQQAPGQGLPGATPIRSIERRVKMLEERLTNTRSKISLAEQNMIDKHKIIFSEIKAFSLELTEVKKDINDVKEKILWVVKELQGFAKREQVEMLKKYIDLWNPVRFVTKKDVEDIVRDVIDDLRREK